MFDRAAHVDESSLQQVPDCGLPRAGGTDNHHTHPLAKLCVELECLVDLERRERTRDAGLIMCFDC